MSIRQYVGALPLSLLPLIVVSACEDGPAVLSASDEDAGSEARPGPDAGSVVDASSESSDAPVDVTPSMCTTEGWCHTHLPSKQTLRDVWADGEGTTWAVSEEGAIVRWNGTAWSVDYTASGPLFAFWGSGPTDLWAGGTVGLLHGTGTSSSTIVWTAVPSLPGKTDIPIVSIWGVGPEDIWAVGGRRDLMNYPYVFENRVLHHTGADWSLDPLSSSDLNIVKVWGTSRTDVWLAGDYLLDYAGAAKLLHLDPGGAAWNDVPIGGRSASMLFGAAGIADRIWLLGLENGASVCWIGSPASGGGLDWANVASNIPGGESYAASGTGPNDVWIAGNDGRLLHWDGLSLRHARIAIGTLPVTAWLRGIWQGPSGDLWVVGSDIALHKEAAQ